MTITISDQHVGLSSHGPSTGTPAQDHGASISVISVAGELDVYTAQELRADLQELLGDASRGADCAGQTRAVVVDLRSVTFLDSYALGVLVLGYKLARSGGLGYALVSTDPMVERLFRMTGLHLVMALHPDVDAAARAAVAAPPD